MQSGHGSQFRHHLAAGHLHLLVINLGGQHQRTHVMALVIHLVQIEGRGCQRQVQVVTALVGQRHQGGDGQAAQLGQQHARQCHAVVHLGQVHVGLVEFHVHGELVGSGCDTLPHHRLDVIVEFLQQVDITAGKFLLGTQRNDLPVGGIHVVDDILDLALAHLTGQLSGQLGDLVHRGDFAAHVDGLRHRQGTAHQVVDVKRQSALGQQRHRRGHILAVDLQRRARARVNHQVVVIGTRLHVERLGGQHLVLLDERHLARIVDVACREVKLRQIGCGGLLALVAGLLDGQRSLLDFLIVAQCHVAARVQRHLLGRRQHRGCTQY